MVKYVNGDLPYGVIGRNVMMERVDFLRDQVKIFNNETIPNESDK